MKNLKLRASCSLVYPKYERKNALNSCLVSCSRKRRLQARSNFSFNLTTLEQVFENSRDVLVTCITTTTARVISSFKPAVQGLKFTSTRLCLQNFWAPCHVGFFTFFFTLGRWYHHKTTRANKT